MLQITETGIVIDKLTDVHQRLTEGFKRIYGDDINLDADSPDGQMIGLFSQEIDNINQAIALIAQMLDPYKAIVMARTTRNVCRHCSPRGRLQLSQ